MSPTSREEARRADLTDRMAAGRRVAAVATLVTLGLVAAKGLVGHLRQSPALLADAVHSAADVVAIFASWLGLKLASRPATKRFPFGLYRAESLAALLVSAVILLAGVRLLVEGVTRLVDGREVAHHSVDVLAVSLVSAVVSGAIFFFERRAGRRLGSQSLLANADESRVDVLTSLAVFAGTGATFLGVARVELGVTVGMSLLIVWLGLRHGRAAVYALLDASLDPDLEARARSIAEGVPGVLKVEQVRLRRAGPMRFGVMHVHVRKSTDVARAHETAHAVVDAVKGAIPSIEMLTIHAEPFRPENVRVAVPVLGDSDAAGVSAHFGRAPTFAFAVVTGDSVTSLDFEANPATNRPARAGLAAINEVLKDRRVDVVLTREIGEIAFHALRDLHVEILEAPSGPVRAAVEAFAAHRLMPMRSPTHESEAAGAPSDAGGSR